MTAVAASDSPSTSPTGNDTAGGRHEEGGAIWTKDIGNGNIVQFPIPAVPGGYQDPLQPNAVATVDVGRAANQALFNDIVDPAQPETYYHIHPSGKDVTSKDGSSYSGGNTTIGSVTTASGKFDQSPAKTPNDLKLAGGRPTRLGYEIVVGARDKTVYFYNGQGVVARMPLDKFVSIK